MCHEPFRGYDNRCVLPSIRPKNFQVVLQQLYLRILERVLPQAKDFEKICDRSLFLHSTFEGFTAVPDALFDLDNKILNECRKYVAWPEALGVDIENIYEPGSRYTFDFDPWVSGVLNYKDDFSWDSFVTQSSYDRNIQIAIFMKMAYQLDRINEEIGNKQCCQDSCVSTKHEERNEL